MLQAQHTKQPRFSPWAYSLDLILPVARLGQSTSWTPVSDGGWLSLPGWTQRLVWFEEVFGWVAALTLAEGVRLHPETVRQLQTTRPTGAHRALWASVVVLALAVAALALTR